MEKFIDNRNTPHYKLLSKGFNFVKEVDNILDAGSGKTSSSILLSCFPQAIVEAIVFPGDLRKISSISEEIVSDRYTLNELDICHDSIEKNYDLVLSHLLLGESIKWGNSFTDLLQNLLSIDSKYFVIYDILEDFEVNYEYLEEYIKDNDYKLLFKESILNDSPQTFTDENGFSFTSDNYICYVIEKEKNML